MRRKVKGEERREKMEGKGRGRFKEKGREEWREEMDKGKGKVKSKGRKGECNRKGGKGREGRRDSKLMHINIYEIKREGT